MSGGAGYVLSKEAIRRFVEKALPNETLCRSDHDGADDVEIGKCLENVDVIAGDSRDHLGRGRFFPFIPEQHLFPNKDKKFWYWSYIYYKTDDVSIKRSYCLTYKNSFRLIWQITIFDSIKCYNLSFGFLSVAIVVLRPKRSKHFNNTFFTPILSLLGSGLLFRSCNFVSLCYTTSNVCPRLFNLSTSSLWSN